MQGGTPSRGVAREVCFHLSAGRGKASRQSGEHFDRVATAEERHHQRLSNRNGTVAVGDVVPGLEPVGRWQVPRRRHAGLVVVGAKMNSVGSLGVRRGKTFNIMGGVGIQHDDGFEGTTLGIFHERLHGRRQRGVVQGTPERGGSDRTQCGVHAAGCRLHRWISIGSGHDQGMLAGRLEVFDRVGDGFGQPGWRFSGTTTDGGFKCCRQRGEVRRGDGVAFIGVGTGHAQDGFKCIHPAHVTVAVGRPLGGPASGIAGGVGIGAQRITIEHQHAIGLVPLVIWTHGRAEHGGRGIDQMVETHWFKSHPARAGEFGQERFLGRFGGGTRHRRGDHRNLVGRNPGQIGSAERVEGRPIGWGTVLQNRSAAIDVVQIKQRRLGERVGATAMEQLVAFELDRTAVH